LICDTLFGSLPGYQKSLRNEQKEKSLTRLEGDITVFDLAVTGEFVAVVAVVAVVVLRFSVKMPYTPYLNPKRIRSLLAKDFGRLTTFVPRVSIPQRVKLSAEICSTNVSDKLNQSPLSFISTE